MFIGVYTIDNIMYNYLYHKNTLGFREWQKDTFSVDIGSIKVLDFKIRGNNYQERKAEAEEIAKDWQNNFACYDWGYSELIEIYAFFEKVGKRYGLIKEFKENAII